MHTPLHQQQHNAAPVSNLKDVRPSSTTATRIPQVQQRTSLTSKNKELFLTINGCYLAEIIQNNEECLTSLKLAAQYTSFIQWMKKVSEH
jgi:hypothetical protein